MTHFVYKVTNKVNGKIYIGITNDIKKRWREHRYNATVNVRHSKFYLAIRKHGIDNFNLEVIYCSLFRDDVEQKEIDFIREYKTTDINFGYNITDGGRSPLMPLDVVEKIAAANRGKKRSVETRQKLSAIGMGRVVPAEVRAKISATEKGRIFSAETKKKISEAQSFIRVVSTPEGIEVVHSLRQFCKTHNLNYYSAAHSFKKHVTNKSNNPHKDKYFCLGVL